MGARQPGEADGAAGGGDGRRPRRAPELAPWWVRGLYLVVGLVLVGLGLLGAYLPLLPTTPFLLLASYFLARSWPALNERVQRIPLFGRYLQEWEQHRGVRQEVKWLASGVCVLTAGLGLWWGPPVPWLQGAVLALVTLGLAVVWWLPTVR
jgi:uncharacterized protein